MPRSRNPNRRNRVQAIRAARTEKNLANIGKRLINDGWKATDDGKWQNPHDGATLETHEAAVFNNKHKRELKQKQIDAMPEYLKDQGWTKSMFSGVWSKEHEGETIRRTLQGAFRTEKRLSIKKQPLL